MNNISSISPHIGLRSIHYWNDLVVAVLSFFGNFILLMMIFFKTTVELKPYSRILLQTCILDLFFATCTFLVKLQIEFKDGILIIMISGFFEKLPNPKNFFLSCLFVFAMYFNIAALPIQFYYRYMMICREKTLSNIKFLACFLISAIFSLGFILLYGISNFPTPEKMERFRYVVDNPKWHDQDGKPPIFIGGDINDPWFIVMLLDSGFIVSSAYTMIVCFSWKIWETLKAMKATMSVGEQDTQKQFTIALGAQAICPLFTIFLPCLTGIICILLKFHIPGLGLIITMAIVWTTVINPICVLIAVSPYRKTLFFWKNNSSSNHIVYRTHAFIYEQRESSIDVPVRNLPPLRGHIPTPPTVLPYEMEYTLNSIFS